MAKFRVSQEADYVMGHLRYGHREGFIESRIKRGRIKQIEK